MVENNDLTKFELKCCIIGAIKEQHVHIYDKSHPDHFNRAKHEASFNEIGALLGVDDKSCNVRIELSYGIIQLAQYIHIEQVIHKYRQMGQEKVEGFD